MAEVLIPEKLDGDDVAKWLNDQAVNTVAKLYPKKHYLINNPLVVVEKPGLSLLGNGSIIHRDDPGWNAANPRTQAHLRFVRCVGLTVKGVVILGAHTNGGLAEDAYVPELEAQHGIDIIECGMFAIQGNIIADIYGDLIYVGGRANRPSQIFNISNNWGARTGRQGISVCNAKNGTVEQNQLWNIRRSMFDTEPIDKTWVVEDVVFRKNILGSYRGYFFAALGEGPIHDLAVEDNLSNDYLTMEVNNRASTEPQPRSNISVLRNKSNRPNFSSPSGKVQVFRDVDKVTVRDNFQHSLLRVVDFARFDGCTDVDYGDNLLRTLPGA